MNCSYVTDNADLIFIRDGLDLLLVKLARAIKKISRFACDHRDQACLGYTVRSFRFLIPPFEIILAALDR